MTARQATFADLDECLRMGRAFSQAAGVESDDESMATTLVSLIEAGSLFVTGEPVHAMAAVLVYQNYFRRDSKVAQELFWWVDESARRNGAGVELLRTIETWAKEQGARELTMVALDALDLERVSGMYTKAGYTPREHNFVRQL